MSSEVWNERARRFGPWVAWGLAALAAFGLEHQAKGLGTAPAIVEVRATTLGAPQTLRVAGVDALPGQHVKQGEVVVRLDALAAEAKLAVARARLAELEALVSAKELSLREDRIKVADRDELMTERAGLALAQLEADAERDRSHLAQLNEQLERQRKLVGEQLASAQALHALELERSALEKKVEAAAPMLQRARTLSAGTQKRLGAWRERDADIERQLAPLRSAADAQREEVKLLELRRDALDVKAPWDGTVSEVLARAHEMVLEGHPVVSLVEDRPSTAIAYVDQSWAGRVQLGDEVSLLPVDRAGPARHGRVVALGPALAETPKRFNSAADKVAFCRLAYVKVEPGGAEVPLLPGQAFSAGFSRGAEQPAAPTTVGAR